jgi:MATE family multidrug resistance protein
MSPAPETAAPAAETPARASLTELVRLAKLGAPVVAAQLAQMGMGLLDTVMAGRVSAEDLSGVAVGGNVIWPAMVLLMGLLMGLTPTIAQLHGAGRTHETGEAARQGLWIALLVGTGVVALVSLSPYLYEALGTDPAIVPRAVAYVETARWGLPGVMLYFVFRYLCEGIGETRPAMLVAFSGLALKGLLNWVFIHGHFGAPALGGLGCAVSTVFVMWFECFAMLLIVSRPRYRIPTGLFERFSRPDPVMLGRLVRLGVPIGLTAFFEMAAFSVVTLLVARFGATAVAAQQIAYMTNGVIFMLALGLGVAATIRVGHELGAGRPEAARRAALVALGTSLVVGLVAAGVLAVANEQIVALFTTETDVARLGAQLILFVAVYLIVDNAQATTIGALRGYKDTRVPMFVALFGYWVVALPIGAGLGFGVLGLEPMNVYGFWVGLALGLAFVAITLMVRLNGLSKRAITAA